MKRSTMIFAAILIAFISGWLCASYSARLAPKTPIDPAEPRIDTIYLPDTDKIMHPADPIRREVLCTTWISAPIPPPDSSAEDDRPDSIAIPLIREQAIYEDSLYTAWVSGIDPALDSLLVHQYTRVITIREPLPAPKRPLIETGPVAGAGITGHGFDWFLGWGIKINLSR